MPLGHLDELRVGDGVWCFLKNCAGYTSGSSTVDMKAEEKMCCIM